MTMTTPDATFLDDSLGAVEQAQVLFTGDIVDVWRKDAVAASESKYNKDEPPKVKFVIRDWAESEGAEEPKLRYTKWLSISTSSRSDLSKFRKGLLKHTGTEPTTWRQFIGLAADFRIYDEENDRFSSQNNIEVKDKPTIPRPDPLPTYVPKAKDEAESGDSGPSDDGSSAISNDAKAAFMETVTAWQGADKGFTEADIRKNLSKEMAFRTQYPAAFAAAVTGKLTKEVLVERDGRYYAD